MFKLAGRHEWEASTKGKWNIQRACGRRGRKEDREGHVVSSSCENIGGDVQKRGESQMIDKGVSAIAIPGRTDKMKGRRKWTQEELGIGTLDLEFVDFLRRFESSMGLVVLSDNRLYRTIPLLHILGFGILF